MRTRVELEQENAQIRTLLLQKESVIHAKDLVLEANKRVIQSKNSAIQLKDAFIEQLKEALILARNRQFAKTTESLRSLQSELFDEAEHEAIAHESAPDENEDDTINVPAHQRKRGGRKKLPEDLPRIDVIHDLADQDKVCPQGHALKVIGDKVSEQLDIIPMQIQVIRNIRKQYVCPCCEGFIKTATKPKQPIEKSQASAGLLSYIAVSKYADSLPLYRQSNILSRFGVQMNRTTLANWMIKCGELVQPLINRLEEHLLTGPFIHMDETPTQVLNEKGKSAESKSYMWVRSGSPPGEQGQNRVVLFNYDPSRSGSVPRRLLADYQGALMVDGYEGYAPVCREQSLVRLGCWVHARRKFVEVSKASKKKNSHAAFAIKLIAKLYAIEKANKEVSRDVRHRARLERAKPIIDKLRTWLDETQPKVPPKTTLGKALHYLNHQWPRLVAYLDDGRYPIDNNPVENAIRPFAVGRKNWLFSASVKGAIASANLYSLIETAKANDLEPYRYLKHLFTELPNATDYEAVDQLLPWKIND
jgi:transposase